MQFNERIILVKINTKPKSTVIIQIYAPATTHEDEKVGKLYGRIERFIRNVRSDESLKIMGDFNSEMGDNEVVGRFGTRERRNANTIMQ